MQSAMADPVPPPAGFPLARPPFAGAAIFAPQANIVGVSIIANDLQLH